MSKYLDENGLLYLWEKITDAIDPKADKVPEVNHGTSDTTFTLTPNIMHIWGEIATLNLTLSADSNSVLDEYMFTFTCPSAAATNLTLPSSIKWIQQPELQAGKTYQVSIVNGLAGYLTDDMPATGQDNIIETVKVNGAALTPDANKAVDITVPQGTVTSVTVNGSNYTPDTNGLVNLGTISGGSGGGEANVIESVKVNGTALTVTNKAVDITAVPASIVTQDATHRFVSDTEKSTWNSKASTDTKNTAGATATTVTGSNKLYLIGASEQTANPTTNTINYFYVDASGLNIPTNINALNQTATLGKIILPGTGGGILADGTGGVQSTTKVWNTFGSYTDISGFITSSDLPTLSKGTTTGSGNAVTDISVSGHTITLTKGSTFLQPGASTDDIEYSEGKGQTMYFQDGTTLTDALQSLDAATSTKATDNLVVHKGGSETITGSKKFQGVYDSININLSNSDNSDITWITEHNGEAYYREPFAWIKANDGVNTTTLQQVLDNKLSTAGGTISGTNRIYFGSSDNSIWANSNGYLMLNSTNKIYTSNDLYVGGDVSCDNISISGGIINDDTDYRSTTKVWNTKGGMTDLTTIYSGSSAPSSSLGNNGDIYIKTS